MQTLGPQQQSVATYRVRTYHARYFHNGRTKEFAAFCIVHLHEVCELAELQYL
jgi:hypothetical protein